MEKKYITDNPNLIAEWNYEKNIDLDPSKITLGSGKKVWWKCSKGHEWEAIINNRYKGRGCPYCSNKKALTGYNDLQTLNPILASEWNYEKNGNLSPKDFMVSSGVKVWWKCNKEHEWQATINHRNNGKGCPYCKGKYTVKGENDLQTVNPSLANEWNHAKNGELTPLDVLPKSNKKVWWKCAKGHEWQAVVYDRNNGKGCPICNSERNTSFPEYAIFYYLSKYDIDTVHSYKENGYELDIYIPSKKVAIEYDGYYWHKDKVTKDLEKNAKCKKDGIKLYRIREGLPSLNDSSIDFDIQKNQKDFPKLLKKILTEIAKTNVDIDLERDNFEIENLREYTEKENSLLFLNPTLAKEWNYKKNGNLRPENVSKNSSKKVWWKCNKEHEWQATIDHRTSGYGCPYCAGRCAIEGKNDLKTINPTLADEWNYEKNGDLMPQNFTASSGKKVWWKCKNGHEWQATIHNRNKGTGCPYCSGRRKI